MCVWAGLCAQWRHDYTIIIIIICNIITTRTFWEPLCVLHCSPVSLRIHGNGQLINPPVAPSVPLEDSSPSSNIRDHCGAAIKISCTRSPSTRIAAVCIIFKSAKIKNVLFSHFHKHTRPRSFAVILFILYESRRHNKNIRQPYCTTSSCIYIYLYFMYRCIILL